MKWRRVITIEENNKHLTYVPLGKEGKIAACIWKDDFDFLLKLGVTPNWTRNGDSLSVNCNTNKRKGNKLSVARVLMNVGPGFQVRYRDKNPLNLRRENISIIPSTRAFLRDRDFVPNVRAVA